MAVSLSISITQNSQNTVNNTSNVTVKVNLSWTNGSWNHLTPSGTLTIDGTKYSFSSSFNPNKTSSGSQTLFTKTVTISHNDNGSKTLACSASFVSGVSSGTVTASASKTLTTIARKSTLNVSNGTLGSNHYVRVTMQNSDFTHTVTYKCGSQTGTICTKSRVTYISWIPSITLARENTTGTSVSVTFTITTYSGNTSIGVDTASVTMSIPASVKPSINTIGVSDPTGYADKYGGYIKGLSKFYITVVATTAYGSPIAKFVTTANGATYSVNGTASNAIFTTAVLKTHGGLEIKSTVTDKRGRSGSSTKTVTVLDYSAPSINSLAVHRCNVDGSENDKGDHVIVTFSGGVSDLNGQNSASYKLEYKRSLDSKYVAVKEGAYSGKSDSCIFAADTGSSYDVRLTVADDFNTTVRNTSVSTGFTLMHWMNTGTAMAIGKISEIAGVFDIGLKTRFFGGILQPVLDNGTDFDTVMVPNTYTLKSTNNAGYANCPLVSGTGTLKIETCGEEGQLHQIVSVCSKTNPVVYERFYYQGTWGNWVCTSDYNGVLLWEGAYYMTASQTITLPTPISKLPNGIVLVFSRYSSGQAQNYHYNHAFVHKAFVAAHPGAGSTFMMTTDGSFSVMATKYLYINDGSIVGNDINKTTGTGTSGIQYENNGFVLRYVIGV